MEQAQIQALLDRLRLKKTEAFQDEAPLVSIIQQIVQELRNIPKRDRPQFHEFVTELKNQLFEAGAQIPGLDLSYFEESEVGNEAESTEEIVADGTSPERLDYLQALFNLMSCLKDDLPTLKNYFLLRLHLNSNANYIPLIVYESGCFYQSVRKRIQTAYGDCKCLSIEDFRACLDNNENKDSSYVVILLVSSKINDADAVIKCESDLKDIISHFDEVNHLSLKKLNPTNASDIINTNDLDGLMDEIRFVTSSFLSNADLANEEEYIIKKLFKDSNCPVLEYKVLKGGKSGSKVIEVRPKTHYANDFTKRYIVKVGAIDDKKKITLEAKRFGEHIEHYSIPKYQQANTKNSMAEAIKYIYASDNSIETSHSFSEIVDNEDNEFHNHKKSIIEELFASEPFELWKQSAESGKKKVADLYGDYINREKFFATVKRIKGISAEQLEKEELCANFTRIFDLNIDSKIKVCHGDLHSENFFKDRNGIYLIDFGFTDRRHALIDHTALECSLKFKHIPFYIELPVLEELEQQLLLDDSFNASFEIKSSRKDIVEYYDLIKSIRLDSLPYLFDINSKIEYFISLFVLTCRHAQYSDLNQLYALKSAEIIGKRLVQLLDA